MLEDLSQQGLASLAELNHLRLEAMRLFEECLTNGDESRMEQFIGQQLLHEPPRLQLLHDLGDDLQQRLLSLREYHFDVRDRVLRSFSENFGIDLTPLSPPDALAHYHELTTEQILAYARETGVKLDAKEMALLGKMVEASIQMAAQLYNDIELTSRLHKLVLDWLDGLNAVVTRQHWNHQSSGSQHTLPH